MYWTFEHMVCFYLLNVHLWTTFRCFAFIFTIWLKCLPVYWFVVAYRKLEPHSKPHWQWRAFICIALHPSQNPCCLLEVKSKRITAHCQCGQSFLFLCAAVEDLCSFFLIQCQRLWRGFARANVSSRDYVSCSCSIPERQESWKSFFIEQSLKHQGSIEPYV